MIRFSAMQILRRAQRLRASFGPHGVVLIYHRVAQPQADPWNLSVSPENFAAQMSVLMQYGVPRTMSDLAQHISTTQVSDRSIAVTFDDGYVDNLSHALPTLQAHKVPATVFVISGAIGKPNAFWWDLLTRVFLETPALPRSLTLLLSSVHRCFDLGASAALEAPALAGHRAWRADLTDPKDGRQRVFLDVWSHMLELSSTEKIEAANYILAWAGMTGTAARPHDGRPMNRDELELLSGSPLIEIGGHTITHPDLSRLPSEEAINELSQGRKILMDFTNQPVDSFAYPYGRYSDQTAAQIKQAGFTCAGWSKPGLVTRGSDAFALPRLHISDLDSDAFEKLLKSVLGPPL